MPRRKKLVIVSALLLAGVGAGFLFRKDKAPDDASSESSRVTGASASTSPSSSFAAAVPRLLDNVESAEQASNGDRVSAPREAERPSPAHTAPEIATSTSIEDQPLNSNARHGNDQSVLKHAPRPAESAAPDISTPTRMHRIRDGDTLPALAERFLGDRKRDQEIFEANRDVLAHPDLLPIGVDLRVPARDGHQLAVEDQGPNDMVPLERPGHQGNARGGN
jgi:hypothetical protein